VSENKAGSDELEHYQRFPPFRTRSSNRQSAPLSAGGVLAHCHLDATAFGSAIFSERSSVSSVEGRAQHLGAGRSQVEILPFRPFQIAAVAEYIRHPSSKRIYAGENPAGSAN
jgi:hypothetical protein